MEGGFWVVIGMSIAYAASFLGMILAYVSYRRRQREKDASPPPEPAREKKE